MSGVWVQVVQFLMALSLLIVLHEGGHFFFARLFKTRVEKFYLFFDFLFPFSNILPFSLFKKKIGDTVWGIGWFPLGGYVKIAGMVDESMDKEQLAKPPEPWEFRSKKAWQRLLIMLGGIIVNVLLAFIIYAMVLFAWGQDRLPLSELKNGIDVSDSLAYKLGFQDGDKIVAINGEKLKYYDDLMLSLFRPDAVVEIERKGEAKTINIPVNFAEQLINTKGGRLFAIPMPAIVDSLLPVGGARTAGMKHGDRILAVNGVQTPSWNTTRTAFQENKGKIVQLTILRDGSNLTLPVQLSDTGTAGFSQWRPENIEEGQKMGFYKVEHTSYGFFQAFPAGVGLAIDKLNAYVQQFRLILNPKTGAYKGLGGFDSMRKIYAPEWDWQHFWLVTAFLSIVLAFMNLLPIPGLDGGYVVFTLIEMITGRKVNEKVVEVATTIGLVLLLGLMLYANGMDVFRWFKK
ncbi:RIP metalloprotease RseP [Taibaiella helva]|uniref:RIP metalloprotease RseP n=1 Tax=Taibaiella helva TaxID=2301235 RepID=UPI000E57FC0D|nr:RIP metalloprotease RseP [Taibaiella helva]